MIDVSCTIVVVIAVVHLICDNHRGVVAGLVLRKDYGERYQGLIEAIRQANDMKQGNIAEVPCGDYMM
jgi:hypothetical protein